MSMGEPALALDDAPSWGQLTVDQYLRQETTNETRHEYSGGQIYAMAGATLNHDRVVKRLTQVFMNHLEGSPCEVFGSDIKVHLQVWNNDVFYYPDLMVVCDSSGNHDNYVESPKLIIEVMSDWDRDMYLKCFTYRHIPSLEEYVVLSQKPNDQRAWIFRRVSDWQPIEITSGMLTFASIDLNIELSSLYAS